MGFQRVIRELSVCYQWVLRGLSEGYHLSVGYQRVSINPVNDTVNDTIALRIYHTQLKIV